MKELACSIARRIIDTLAATVKSPKWTSHFTDLLLTVPAQIETELDGEFQIQVVGLIHFLKLQILFSFLNSILSSELLSFMFFCYLRDIIRSALTPPRIN